MTKKQKKWMIRIIIALVLFLILFGCEHTGVYDALNRYVILPICIIPYLIAGYDVLIKAAKNIAHGQIFDENFLMMIATFGAFAIQEYTEAVAVMLFYQIGELFQNYAVEKSRQSISDLMEIYPEYAWIEADGKLIKTEPDEVCPGTVITVLPGERIPIDGVVTDGESMIDMRALTGESVPKAIHAGDDIISGCINEESTLKVRTTKDFDDSTVAKILELVEDASSKKAKTENFITRFAKYYTPIVTIGALFMAVIPSVIYGEWTEWLQRACIFLVISCPCALVISVPLGFFGGIGALSRIGVLVKGSNYLEIISDISTIVFDKTGTLTQGDFKVNAIYQTSGFEKDKLLEIATLAEGYSTHPIAKSIKEAYLTDKSLSYSDRKIPDMNRTSDAKEISGHGIKIYIDGMGVLIGNEKLMDKYDVAYEKPEDVGTIVYVATSGEDNAHDISYDKPDIYTHIGTLVISDTIKDGCIKAIHEIKKLGVTKTIMLTGDDKIIAEHIANDVGIDEVHAGLLPADKVSIVDNLSDGASFTNKAGSGKEHIAFVGDGINDAPVLVRSSVGIAMGSMGSDAAIEAADIVIMDDDLAKIPTIIRIAKKTMRIVRQNIVFALTVKLAVLLLGTLGMANMWEAVFADVGVAVLAILNSMRTLSSSRHR